MVGLASLFRHGIMRLFNDCKTIASCILVANQVENMKKTMGKCNIKRAPLVIQLYPSFILKADYFVSPQANDYMNVCVYKLLFPHA